MYYDYGSGITVTGLPCIACNSEMTGIHSYTVRFTCTACGGAALGCELKSVALAA